MAKNTDITKLDPTQTWLRSFEDSQDRFRITPTNALVTDPYDNIQVTYPDAITEVYTYKLGSTTTSTVTVVYTDASKASLSSVTKS